MTSLLRRGVDLFSDGVFRAHIADDVPKYQMPAWGVLVLSITILVFVLVSGSVSYTYGKLVPTLMMIESPESILFEPLAPEDPDSVLRVNKAQPESLLVEQARITSTFRTTIAHLRSKAGFLSRFRGLSIWIVYGLAVQMIMQPFSAVIPVFVSMVVGAVVCAQLSTAWTHIVISDPSPKRWYRRLPPFKTWKKVAGPTALLAIAEQLAVGLPTLLATHIITSMVNEDSSKPVKSGQVALGVVTALGSIVLAAVLTILLVIPANVTLTRIQASLLPDSDETIVPFDRTFDGKVVPEIVGGSGAIGFVDAWKTFDWNSRVRLLKAYIKVTAIQTVLSILFLGVLFGELHLILGGDWSKLKFGGRLKIGN